MTSDGQVKNILVDDRFRIGVKLGAGNFGEIRIGMFVIKLNFYIFQLEMSNQ